MDKKIYCIRHGQTEYNKNGIVQGSGIDSDLNEIGHIQASQFHEFYQDKVSFDLIIYSALKRTKQTVVPWLNYNITTWEESRINEMSWGDAEGTQGSPESIKHYKSIVESWKLGNLDVGIKNGETALELKQRLVAFVNDLRNRKENNILLCSHGRAMKGLLCAFQNIPFTHMEDYPISNVGLYIVVQKANKFEVLSHNNTQHRTPLDLP